MHPQLKSQLEMIGNCDSEIVELKARVGKCEEGQVALGESHLELRDHTEKYIKKTDDTIADSKLRVCVTPYSLQEAQGSRQKAG